MKLIEKLSPAARLELVLSLLHQPIYDEDENFIGYEDINLITKEEAIKILNGEEE